MIFISEEILSSFNDYLEGYCAFYEREMGSG